MPRTGAGRGRSWMPVTKKPPFGGLSNMAERGQFEPPRRYKRLPDFESGTFNRSANSPDFPGRRAATGGAMIRAAGSADQARAVARGPSVTSLKSHVRKLRPGVVSWERESGGERG